jgi:hypothetical protein
MTGISDENYSSYQDSNRCSDRKIPYIYPTSENKKSELKIATSLCQCVPEITNIILI